METTNIRNRLHSYIDTIEDKKAEAIYILFQDEIEHDEWEYPEEFKAELDNRYEYYQSGGKLIGTEEADERIKLVLQSGTQK